MALTEIESLLKMTYNNCVTYLLKKYGNVPDCYFINEINWNKNTKITRGNEGLYIHHIDEDKAIMLSTPAVAKRNPYSYQMGKRLVYCNLLEHLVLHIKIIEYPNSNQNESGICGIGGIFKFIVPELNDIYSGIKYKAKWKLRVVKNIINLENDYLKCIEQICQLNQCKNEGFEKLKSSFNEQFKRWNKSNNKAIYKKIDLLIKKYQYN